MSRTFLSLIKNQVAELAVTNSSLRNQGAPGVVETARKFLKDLDVSVISAKDEASFLSFLDRETESLRLKFPKDAKNWGAARKTLNLFLRDSLYNRYLCEQYALQRLELWLEVPLDADVAHGLKNSQFGGPLPRWVSIKELKADQSAAYQAVATKVASEQGFARVHLDLIFWRQRKQK